MITEISGTKNGYLLGEEVTADELKTILNRHPVIRCIIVNAKTRERFSRSRQQKDIFTINNNAKDNEFYVNSLR